MFSEKFLSRIWIIVLPPGFLALGKVAGMVAGRDQVLGCMVALVVLAVFPSTLYFYFFRVGLNDLGLRGWSVDMTCLLPGIGAALLIPVSALYERRFPPEDFAPFPAWVIAAVILAGFGMPGFLFVLGVLARTARR